MEQDNWQHVRQLFDQVCDLPPEQWEPHLNHLSNDPAVIAQTLRLLQAQTVELGSVREQIGKLIHQVDQGELGPGDRIGPWQLRQCLARGGMGVVYLAERADGMYSQQVAVKLLPGMCDERAAAQLVAERRILASLQHPNIARLYDGGTSPAGQPYLVMEYSQGQPLDQWLAAVKPGLQQRLQLFLVICRAVQEAHARMVLHGDLKPANILITTDGQPLLVDFGVARLLEGTIAGERLAYCTPAYAAPELLHGQELPDTRSDVFSLGLLLSQLLTDVGSERGLTSWNTGVPAPSQVAGAQCPWKGKLRGDLDAIVAKACALAPAQRYPSVAALARDLQASQQRRPISARGNGMGYRSGRWLQRNGKWLLLLLCLLLLVAGFVWQLEQQRQRAERSAKVAEQVSSFMVAMFEAANPRTRGARASAVISAEDVLDQAAARIDGQLEQAPEVRARLQGVIGLAYRSAGNVPKAIALLGPAAEGLASSGQASDQDEAARLFNLLSGTLAQQRDGVVAERMARRALALVGPAGEGGFRQAQSYNSLGLALLAQQRYAQALAAFELAHANHQRAGRTFYVGVSADNIGMLHRRSGNAQAALAAFAWSTPMFQRTQGENSYDYWASNTERAMAQVEAGQLAPAIAAFQSNLQAAPGIFGEHSVYVSSETLRLGAAWLRKGDLEQAGPHLQQALTLTGQVMGKDSYSYSLVLASLAQWALAGGQLTQAQQWAEQALDIRVRIIGSDNPDTFDARLELAAILLAGGDPGQQARAQALLEQVQQQWLPVLQARSSNSVRIRLLSAEWQLAQGQLDAAQQTLAACAADAQALTPHLSLQQQALQARLYQQQGDARAPAAWAAVLRQGQALYGRQSVWLAQWQRQAAAAGAPAHGRVGR